VSKIDTVEATPTAKHGERPARDKMVPRKRRGKQAIGGPGVSISAACSWYLLFARPS